MHIHKKSTSLLRISVFAQVIQSWKTLLSKSLLGSSAHVRKKYHVSIKIWSTCQRTKYNNDAQNTLTYLKGIMQIAVNLGTQKSFHASIRICVYAQIIQRWKSCYPKSLLGISAHVHKKTSTSQLRICIYAQIIQRWKTLLTNITIRNFCACTPKYSMSLLRICVYAQKIQQMIIIQSSNNPIVDVLRPAQKLQGWNTYIGSIAQFCDDPPPKKKKKKKK